MSKTKKPLFDTAIFIQFEKKLTPSLLEKMKFSIVVLYELTATTIDKEYLQKLNSVRQTFYKRGDLLVPTMNDWWETAKMIRQFGLARKRLYREKRRKCLTLTDCKTTR